MNNPRPSQSAPASITTVIGLTQVLPNRFTLPRYQLGQTVQWINVSPSGFGTIVGLVYANGVSVVADGYHYLVLLDRSCPSFSDCAADWAFEEDIDLIRLEVAA
ncbi:hypothetical protein ACQ4M3_38855 [Leptolyngbya sp. AN03gr2]|uniref:hypothetical protein n=1 Tax=unclassified Leptolyngbya TaxID=2650499 RepID=UPI003D320E10